MSRLVDDLRACASAWEPCVHLVARLDDVIALCDRYERAVELLHMLDRPDARHPDVAAFLDGEVEP